MTDYGAKSTESPAYLICSLALAQLYYFVLFHFPGVSNNDHRPCLSLLLSVKSFLAEMKDFSFTDPQSKNKVLILERVLQLIYNKELSTSNPRTLSPRHFPRTCLPCFQLFILEFLSMSYLPIQTENPREPKLCLLFLRDPPSLNTEQCPTDVAKFIPTETVPHEQTGHEQELCFCLAHLLEA